ncbi:MAG TPA: nucleotide exchange factor GrpE [Candidatus Obscuribacterales bacterium]
MGTEELDDAKGAAEGENKPSQDAAPSAPVEEERGARVDAAKAFFRAMYAGEDPPANAAEFAKTPQETATKTACRNCEGLEQSLREVEVKAAEAEKLYTRMAADFENFRKRMERERDESVSFGVKKAAEAMMPALDDLDRAMQFLNADTPADKLLESFKLVGTRLLQCMEGLGLKSIETVGQPFDPKFHEPVQQVETSEFPDGVVMQELRRGYTLGDRTVRPALVNVASNSGPATPVNQEAALDSTMLDRSAAPELTKTAEPAGTAQDDAAKVYDLEGTDEEKPSA